MRGGKVATRRGGRVTHQVRRGGRAVTTFCLRRGITLVRRGGDGLVTW